MFVPAALAEALGVEAWAEAAIDAERACAGAPAPRAVPVDVVAAVVARRAAGIVIDELERLVAAAPPDLQPRAESARDALVDAFRGLTVQIGGDPAAAELAAAHLGLPEGGGPKLDTSALRQALEQAIAVANEVRPGDWAALEPLLGSLACAGAAVAAAADALEAP